MAIVDRHEDRVGLRAQIATECVVGGVAAEHPATAVEISDDRVRSGRRRSVEPVLEFGAVGAWQHQRFAGLAVTISALVLNVANVYNWIVTPVEALEYGAQRRFRLIVTAE